MANRIPESFIAEVRQKVNIVDVIGQYTQLVKRGRQWTGPVHSMMTVILHYSWKKISKFLIAFLVGDQARFFHL